MRIAVTTPTGNVGRHVLAMLVRAGVRPLVLARDPSKLEPELLDAVDAAVVDQRDAEAVVAATAGVDALYWVDPTGMSSGLRDGFVPEQPRSLRTTTPTTLAAWANDELRPLLPPS